MKNSYNIHSMYSLLKTGPATILILFLLLVNLSFAEEIVMFNGDLGTKPSLQGWQFYSDKSTYSQTAYTGYTNLDTTADRYIHAGYASAIPPFFSHPSMPELDRAKGFIVRFKVRVNNEVHTSDDRAGFSLIVTSKDLMGLELAFWNNEIWVQTDTPNLFTHSIDEFVIFNTTTGLIQYELDIQGDNFTLYADGTKIMTGSLHNYSSFNDPPLDFAYKIPSFLFLGDDTTRGSADIDLANVSVYLKTVPGDVDGDKIVSLADAVLALKVCVEADVAGIVTDFKISGADVGGNGVVGPEEAAYVLSSIANQ